VTPSGDAGFFLLLLKDPSANVRRVAVEALGRVDSALAAEPLRLALADEDAGVRVAAATSLSRIEGEEALRDLRSLAEDPDPRVRAVAVHGVARRLVAGAPAAEPAGLHATLTSALQDDALVALAAVESLHELGGELSHAATAVLERPEPELVREAVRCLGASGGETVLASLLPLVSHPDWSVRAEAIRVLAERRFLRAAPAILGLLDSERDDFVRDAILQALERLEG
jgi:HEAT repeat protein